MAGAEEWAEEAEDWALNEKNQRLRLRVRVQGVRDLAPPRSTPPSTFVAVRTSYGRGKTPVIPSDANPPFNDEFLFDIINPEREEVEFTVVALTSEGYKKIGQCVLSLKNILCGVEWRAWVGLIRHARTERAYERGAILISLFTKSFGARALPPLEDEDKFRENMRNLLTRNAAEELHRLEWYVGECMNDYSGAFSELCKEFQRPRGSPVAFELTVRNIFNLTEEDGSPTSRSTCFVRVTVAGIEKTTKEVPFHREAGFNEKFSFKLLNSLTGIILLEVFSSDYKFGECQLSLAGVQPGVPKERSHAIVHAAGTGDACYCGNITVVLRSNSLELRNKESEVVERDKRRRLQNYLWRYLRDDLHRLDPISGSIDDLDKFMLQWTQTYGPEPQQHLLNLTLKTLRCATKSKLQTFAIFVRLGPEIFRTKSVRGEKEVDFNIQTGLSVCSPLNDEFTFIVVSEKDGTDAELARCAISLKNLPFGKRIQQKLRMFQKALTADATEYGTLTIELGACDFNTLRKPPLTADKEKYFIERVEALLLRYDPAQVHRARYLLGEYSGKEEELLKHLTDAYGPETGVAPMRIRVMGIRQFSPICSCYVKVYIDGSPVIRTKNHHPAREINFDIGMKNEATVSLKSPQRSKLTFKVGKHHWYGSRVLGKASMSLRNLLRGEPNICWISLFPEGASDEIGQIGVELQSIGFAKGTITLYRKLQGKTVDSSTALDLVTKDVTSLIRKYKPEELPNVQPLIAGATSLKDAHTELRDRFSPRTVAMTFYINIQNLEMSHVSDKDAALKGLLVVGASCAGTYASSVMKTAFANSVDAHKYYPEVRIDIPVSTEPIDMPSSLSLEIILSEKLVPVKRANSGRKSSTLCLSHSEREVGRSALSLRSLLTPKAYKLGESLTIPIIRTNDTAGTSHTSRYLPPPTRSAIVGEITLNITIPLFETVPRWLCFDRHIMRPFHRGYVRHYQSRIGAFLRRHDPMQLRDFHFALYERDVALGRWPVSLYHWLNVLIKTHGPEQDRTFGPPLKFYVDSRYGAAGDTDDDSAPRPSAQRRLR